MGKRYQHGQTVLTNEAGQAVLIVLLSLSVVLVVVMYILSRSITDISLSTKDENAMRAFSAAEAGIEKALVTGSTGPLEIGDASFNASVTDFAAGQASVVYPVSLKSGELATFWFVEHDSDGNLVCDATHPCFSGNRFVLCWGDPDTSDSLATTPAIELTVYYTTTPLDMTTLQVARGTYDVNAARRDTVAIPNHFDAATNVACTIAGQDFQFRKGLYFHTTNPNLGVPNSETQGIVLYATVKMLYNTSVGHKIGLSIISSTSPLPSQGSLIDSLGSYGGANRRISVYQLHPVVPPIFTNVLYSGTGITK